ncbi:hypothetical protein GCM10022207_67180 [Streptomyces lannensis]|uniref:Transposase n=1 Tax=Streptomyces lannensis TaxID=766498 RepID=A0ABP7KYD5_9ACTN
MATGLAGGSDHEEVPLHDGFLFRGEVTGVFVPRFARRWLSRLAVTSPSGSGRRASQAAASAPRAATPTRRPALTADWAPLHLSKKWGSNPSFGLKTWNTQKKGVSTPLSVLG